MVEVPAFYQSKLVKFRRKNQIKNEIMESEMNFEYFHRQNQGF
jgi:hypothetical protein